jgi:hypothetical protein
MAEKVAVPESSLNEAEAELYDRQLRLWGFEAQQRMQKSKILFCGIRGLFAEVGHVALSLSHSLTHSLTHSHNHSRSHYNSLSLPYLQTHSVIHCMHWPTHPHIIYLHTYVYTYMLLDDPCGIIRVVCPFVTYHLLLCVMFRLPRI